MSTEATPLLRRGPFAWFTPDPPAATIQTDPREIRNGYRHWQPRILLASTIGYAVYYFVRVNLPVAMPVMEKKISTSPRPASGCFSRCTESFMASPNSSTAFWAIARQRPHIHGDRTVPLRRW